MSSTGSSTEETNGSGDPDGFTTATPKDAQQAATAIKRELKPPLSPGGSGLFAGLQVSNSQDYEQTPVISNTAVSKSPVKSLKEAPVAPSLIGNKDSNNNDTLLGTVNINDETIQENKQEEETAGSEVSPEKVKPAKREIPPEEEKQLDEAFQHSSPSSGNIPITPVLKNSNNKKMSTTWQVSHDTPIPNADICLRLLRKFAHKTRPKILKNYGGSQSRSILSYIMKNDPQQETTFQPYSKLLDCIFDEGEDRDIINDADLSERLMKENHSDNDNNRHTRQGVLIRAVDPTVTARANDAIAHFIHLFNVWGHASSALLEKNDRKGQQAFSNLHVAIMDCASNLSAYGCLNNVMVAIPNTNEYHVAAQILATSVFNSDLTLEKVELAAMKFLLGTGCQQNPSLLRGSYLLQSIRTLYHIYLTTESRSNKVTARAALQQLVTSVFTKVVQTDVDHEHTSDVFPSDNHRDAFLVLRSICKLSMRNLPDSESGMHSHVGLQTSASNDTWDAEKLKHTSERGPTTPSSSSSGIPGSPNAREHQAHLIYTSAIHPALESKLLALELILYVLQNTHFTVYFIQHCGPQFHAAIRNYLCVSLLKNCTSGNTEVVNLSLRIFVPVVRNFRTILKTEIEAFVTNVFFVILDSKNSPAEHKSIVVNTFNEICSDPSTLAEIFLNYDCDLSAVDLFHRIVNTLSKLSRTGLQEPMRSSGITSFMAGPTEAQMEKHRNETRELRLDAMRALRQILASLHASIVEPLTKDDATIETDDGVIVEDNNHETNNNNGVSSSDAAKDSVSTTPSSSPGKQSFVEIYGSKKKRRAEESEAILRFNQKPSAGIAFAAKCKHIDAEDPADVARYLLKNKDDFDKTQIGEYLGREAEYQNGFSIKVLHEYVRLLDFSGLTLDDAIRFFLSGFRLPGEAQKIDRIMEKFAERYTEQNPSVFPSADVAFILSFSIIMLNTDLHNPSIKEERRMTKEGFIRNNRGIADGQDLPEEVLTSIFDRIKENAISLKEDDEARERVGESNKSSITSLPSALNPASFFTSHYNDIDRARETNFQKERDHIVRTTESLLKRRRHGTDKVSPSKSRSGNKSRHASKFVLSGDSGLRDEYVSPMFEVTWGPALAAFSTAMESANGTAGSLISIASDEELELAAENAAETIEVCLTGFRFAITTAGLCGNSIARDAYMLGLSRFSQLGTGVLLEPRHIRCVQTMLSLAREDGELLGGSWEHVFRSLSEINRFHQLFHLMARNDRAAAMAAERRRQKLEAKEKRREARERRKAAAEDGESINSENLYQSESDDDSLADSGLFTDEEDFEFEENMDAKAIDEANAREIYDAVSEATIEAIYERSSSLSAPAVKEFVLQLCLVSRAEISVGNSGKTDLTQVAYRQKHALLSSGSGDLQTASDQFHHTQPNIYNLQKLVEVTHYNMDSRPRLLFAELWVVVADHLTETALHTNPAIAMYAVDSFRQLSIQYLQRDELEVFEFQRRFLKPLETVMAQSKQSSTKELLLNCVARLIHVFGPSSKDSRVKGGLRSGWIPILTILGLGGRDEDSGIAELSFKILSSEIELCLQDGRNHDVLLKEHFVETVNSLLQIVSGPHDDLSVRSIGELVKLTGSLAEGEITPPMVKRKSTKKLAVEQGNTDNSKKHLELWWPILLGLSHVMGDHRPDLRSRSLEALFGIINEHFFPTDASAQVVASWENLQLIFRGVLNSILEYAEASSDDEPTPGLPEDFELILNDPKEEKISAADDGESLSWLETTFDPFMDACITICLRSLPITKDPIFLEEVFALLNSCLLSDSGALAVRGLRRLEQFVTSDLDSTYLTDDIWATVSHMLQRCLTVRGLPKKVAQNGSEPKEDLKAIEREYEESVKEFVAEENFLPHRRYIGCNATMVVGMLLCSDRFSIGFRWRLFLIKWLSRGIREWDTAAQILSSSGSQQTFYSGQRPPDYRENAVYGRKWINRLVLQLASIKEVAQAPSDADPKESRFVQAQKQVIELTEALLLNFVQKETVASQYRHSKIDEILYKRYIALVQELLSGFGNMDAEYLQQMAWISPVLLSSCIRSKNEDVRLMVQKVVSKTTSTTTNPAPHAIPPVATKETEKTVTVSEVASTENGNTTSTS